MSSLCNDLQFCNFLILVGVAVFTLHDIIPEGFLKTVMLNIGFYSTIIGIILGVLAILYYLTHKGGKK